jgi:hypothetical protein
MIDKLLAIAPPFLSGELYDAKRLPQMWRSDAGEFHPRHDPRRSHAIEVATWASRRSEVLGLRTE